MKAQFKWNKESQIEIYVSHSKVCMNFKGKGQGRPVVKKSQAFVFETVPLPSWGSTNLACETRTCACWPDLFCVYQIHWPSCKDLTFRSGWLNIEKEPLYASFSLKVVHARLTSLAHEILVSLFLVLNTRCCFTQMISWRALVYLLSCHKLCQILSFWDEVAKWIAGFPGKSTSPRRKQKRRARFFILFDLL